MRRLASHLGLCTPARIANIWLLTTASGRRLLVDTGHPVERLALRRGLRRAGVRGAGDLDGVLLTHRHSDHAGNAAWLRKRYDCPIICHAADAAVLMGEAPYPRLARGQARLDEELLCRIEDRFPARCQIDETLDEGPWRHDLHVVPVPGHTEGSVMLYHAPTRTLFSGDTVVAGIPPTRFVELLRPTRPGFSLDVERSYDHLRRFLRELPPTDFVCAGHGPLVHTDAEAKLRKLLARL